MTTPATPAEGRGDAARYEVGPLHVDAAQGCCPGVLRCSAHVFAEVRPCEEEVQEDRDEDGDDEAGETDEAQPGPEDIDGASRVRGEDAPRVGRPEPG